MRSLASEREMTIARSCLELFLQLVEETPIGALDDQLLRIMLEHPHFGQSPGIEAQRVLWVGFSPTVVHAPLHHFQSDGVARFVELLGEETGSALGVLGADVGRLEDRTQRALGRD